MSTSSVHWTARLRPRQFVLATAIVLAPALAHATEPPRPSRITAATLVRAGRVDAVAGTQTALAVVRDGRVSIVDLDGRPLAALDDELERPPQARRRRLGPAAEQLLDRADVPEPERDDPDALRLLDDELGRRERAADAAATPAQRSAIAQMAAPVVAASAEDVWVGWNGRLVRVAPDGRRRTVGSRWFTADGMIASPGGRLLAVVGSRLSLSEDGGATFTRLAPLPSPAHAFALGDRGPALVATPDGLLFVDADEARWALPPKLDATLSVRGIATCANRYHVLADEGLFAVTARGGFVRLADAPDARALACTPSGGVVAYGPGIHLLDGARWTEVSWPEQERARRVLAAGGALLVVTDTGLWRLAPAAPGVPPPLGGADEPGPMPWTALAPAPTRATPPAWARVLPKLGLEASFDQGGLHGGLRGNDLRVLAVAQFVPSTSSGPAAAPAPPSGAPAATSNPHPPEPSDDDQPRGDAPPGHRAVPDQSRRGAGARSGPALVPNCLRELQRVAVTLALADPRRARSLVDRAARANWLPELRLRVERRVGRREALDAAPSAGWAYTAPDLDTVDEVRYEARATWDLARIVFSPEELQAHATAVRLADTRREIVAAVDRLFFERRRLEASVGAGRADAPAGDDRDGEDEDDGAPSLGASRRLRLGEVEAELGALTDGASSSCR